MLGLYWGYIGIMEKKASLGFGVILGSYWDNGKENGSYYSILVYIYIYILGLFLLWVPKA